MTWTPETSHGNESAKIAPLIVPYTRGRVLDIGCGNTKAYAHFIGVDSHKDAQLFGADMRGVDVKAEADDLSMFADNSMDAVFSSHLLEHMQDTVKTLREWWRVIKPGGHLVLYLPHKEFYPNIGENGANADHKHDFLPDDIISAMRHAGKSGWQLLENEDRNDGNEYSFFQVYRKTTDRKYVDTLPPKPEKRLLVIRYGAFGDLIQSSSILPLLKAEGWHITFNCDPRGYEVLHDDPHIDAFLVQDKDQVPNEHLQPYWAALATRYDRVINLSSVIEWTLLPIKADISWQYSPAVRHALKNVNYMERMHDIAEVPHVFNPRFYPDEADKRWARKMRKTMAGDRPVVMVALKGSARHKIWPHNHILVGWLLENTEATIVLVSDAEGVALEEMIINKACSYFGCTPQEILEAFKDGRHIGMNRLLAKKLGADRIKCTSGVWSIRNSMSFALECDVVVGPETGLMNAVAMEPMRKVMLLSHSSVENLTKHWVNTVSLTTNGCSKNPGYPCHKLHADTSECALDDEGAATECMAGIATRDVYIAVEEGLLATTPAQAAE